MNIQEEIDKQTELTAREIFSAIFFLAYNNILTPAQHRKALQRMKKHGWPEQKIEKYEFNKIIKIPPGVYTEQLNLTPGTDLEADIIGDAVFEGLKGE